jgi:formylglycine-generating enzyme required for sulfatase activity
MLPERLHWVIEGFEPEGDPWLLLQIARDLEAEGNLEGAAAVYDRAFVLEPTADKVRQGRADLLEQLAVVEKGLVFRYVPGGPFLMGNRDGEDDEKPLHPVWLAPYWLSETPITWADYCRLMDWQPPPEGHPRDTDDTGLLYWENQLRRALCEERSEPRRHDTRPMVAVGWQAAEDLARKLSTAEVRYALPTEAQWEKAARGGLHGARHAWGDQPPSPTNCDFNHFHDRFTIRPSETFPANGYGLYAMNGGVWEWTADWYDRDYYQNAPPYDPPGPDAGEEKVLRGGSYTDCAEAVTVSFRMSRSSAHWRDGQGDRHIAPNIGFRLCRTVVGQRWPG